MRKCSRIFLTVTLLIGSIFFSMVVGEIALRLFYPQRIYYNISQFDPYVGFTYMPNIEGYSKTVDYEATAKINSRGLRDREFDYTKPSNVLRIGVFGDSFTFGEGVQDDEPYPKVLEKLLRKNEEIGQINLKIEVLNFGIGKTGTSHQFAWYQKEGQKYELDVVIVGFLAGNDFNDNLAGVFQLRDGKLFHNPRAYSYVRRLQRIVYYIPFYKWVASHSHLINLLRKTGTVYHDANMSKESLATPERKVASSEEINKNMVIITTKLVEQFHRKTMRNGSTFLLVNLPAKGQKGFSQYSHTEKVPDYVLLCDALLNNLEKKHIKVIDLVPVFANLPQSIYYFKNDGHMTSQGHQLVATALLKALLPDIVQEIREQIQ